MAQEFADFIRTRKKANLAVATVNIAVFIVLCILGDPGSASFMAQHGGAYTPLILEGEYYRLFTAMFLHFSFMHLANNMICMLFIGDMVETAAGPWRYLVICLGGGLIGNLCSLWWDLRTGTCAVSAGASGCVFALIGAALLMIIRSHRSEERDSLLRRFGLLAVLSVAQGFMETGTDNAAHIGGLAGGFVLAALLSAAASFGGKSKKRRREI